MPFDFEINDKKKQTSKVTEKIIHGAKRSVCFVDAMYIWFWTQGVYPFFITAFFFQTALFSWKAIFQSKTHFNIRFENSKFC